MSMTFRGYRNASKYHSLVLNHPFLFCGLLVVRTELRLLFEHLSSDCRPIASKLRQHFLRDVTLTKSEVEGLLPSGIIEPPKLPWRESKSLLLRRLVIEYCEKINHFTYSDAYPHIDELVGKTTRYEVYSTLNSKSVSHRMMIKEKEEHYTAFETHSKLFCRIALGMISGLACF